MTLKDGDPLDVTVVDREQQAQGFFYRVWRRLTLRSISTGRSIQSLRQALEQEALLAYAAIAAGANAPKLIATSELGPDAVMLVYEHTGGRSLDSLPDEEITDELMRNTWHQVQALQSRRIAHRRLVGDAILVDRAGAVIVTDLRGGEIAAGDIVLRMDIAQLLTTLGLRAGAERSVAAAVAVLGPDKVADSLPLLQPLALSRSSRATLRQAGAGAGAAGARGGDRGVGGGEARQGQGQRGAGRQPQGRPCREEGREGGHRRRGGRGARGGSARADAPSGAADPSAGARRTGPAGTGQTAHPAHRHRRVDRRVLPVLAAGEHPLPQPAQQHRVGLGRRRRAVLRGELRGCRDEPDGIRPREGAVLPGGPGAGRRVLRETGGAGGGRRCGAQHPLPATRGRAARSRGGQCRGLAGCSGSAATSCC